MSQWFYAQNNERKGPISENDLHYLVSTGQLNSSDPVWKKGMADWMSYQQALFPGTGQTQMGSSAAAAAPPPVSPSLAAVASHPAPSAVAIPTAPPYAAATAPATAVSAPAQHITQVTVNPPSQSALSWKKHHFRKVTGVFASHLAHFWIGIFCYFLGFFPIQTRVFLGLPDAVINSASGVSLLFGIVAMCGLVLYIVSGVLFYVWTYRTLANAQVFRQASVGAGAGVGTLLAFLFPVLFQPLAFHLAWRHGRHPDSPVYLGWIPIGLWTLLIFVNIGLYGYLAFSAGQALEGVAITASDATNPAFYLEAMQSSGLTPLFFGLMALVVIHYALTITICFRISFLHKERAKLIASGQG